MFDNPFSQKNIALGITGSIAAYKAVELASKLTKAGARVDVIMTQSAVQFVTPLTFASVTGRPAFTDADLWGAKAHVLHIGLAEGSDLMVIAPASANTIAKLAHGIADNLLTVSYLAYAARGEKKAVTAIAPAMDAGMFSNPLTQQNVHTLAKYGAHIIGPEYGRLASGLTAKGRMTEAQDIFAQLRFLLSRNGRLKGCRVIVTAGGTQEAIDPVRIITNHSSGKQGYAVAQAALDDGADVTLITTPVSLAVPYGAQVVNVRTAQEMDTAVRSACKDADVLIMAAAVADYRPAHCERHKIKKSNTQHTIELEPTQDILSGIAQQREQIKRPGVVIGFAAETDDLLANARQKLERKNLDMIVANDVSAMDAGFSVDTNRVTLLLKDESIETLPLMTKDEVAQKILEKVIKYLKK
jgi:phosphopantothenoylcysteine decarboxylase / phosphopantothenate---cysteine ligase